MRGEFADVLRNFALLFALSGAFVAVEDVRFGSLSEAGGHKLGFHHVLDLFNLRDVGGFVFMGEGVYHLVGDALGIHLRVAFPGGHHGFFDSGADFFLLKRDDTAVSFDNFFKMIFFGGHFLFFCFVLLTFPYLRLIFSR